jgi:uncharacterized protein (TIGR02246 family)
LISDEDTKGEKTMKRFLVFLMIVAASSVIASSADGKKDSPNGKVEEELKTLTRQMITASAGERDPEVFDRVFADDCTMVGAAGIFLNKTQIMDIVRHSNFRHRSSTIRDMQVRVYDNIAVVNDASSVQGSRGTQEFDENFWASRIYVKRDGQWRIVASQVTKVAANKP